MEDLGAGVHDKNFTCFVAEARFISPRYDLWAKGHISVNSASLTKSREKKKEHQIYFTLDTVP